MIKHITVYIMPCADMPNTKKYLFLWFRDDDYINDWLEKNNVDWYQKIEWTIYSYIRYNIIQLLNK